MIDVIARLPAAAILRFTGRAVRMSTLPPHLNIVNDAIDFARAIDDCDAVIGYGSHNLACEALLAGKPLALIAKNPDQPMTAERVKALGAGIVLPERPSAGSAGQLQALLADPQYRRGAQAFAQRHGAQRRSGIADTLLAMALVESAAC